MNNQNKKKTLRVYYRGIEQKIHYYNSLQIKQFKETVKQVYDIEEPVDDILFQDEDGDIVMISEDIPDNLQLHVFIKYNKLPIEPKVSLKVNSKPIQSCRKCHWVISNEDSTNIEYTNLLSNNNHTYKPLSNSSSKSVKLSITFTEGEHFFVISTGKLHFYSSLLFLNAKTEANQLKDTDLLYGEGLDSGTEKSWLIIGIYINMNERIYSFHDYDKQDAVPPVCSGKIPADWKEVIFLAWIKRSGVDPDRVGISLLNEGEIPVPSWIYKSLEKKK